MLALLLIVLLLTALGRIVTVTGAAALCSGWPICLPRAPLGWVQFAHRLLVALAAVMMLQILRKAWREQRENTVLLPLTTVTTVLFFGQAFIGALGATNGYPRHLAILHGLTATSLWIALASLTFVSGSDRP
jgi:protoheme IX farnesyltransferase